MFVTVWFGILTISTGKLVETNAGHEYPVIRKSGGKFEIIETDHSLVCGAMEGMPYDEDEIWLEKGGTFFIYTDGVPEATNGDDELFGVERMLASLNQNPDAGPKELLAKVRKDVDDFVGDAPQFDDLTMMAIRLK